MDQKKGDRKLFFSDNDHKLYLTYGSEKHVVFGSLFLEEALSEEQLIRKSGINGGRSYQKKSDQKNG